MRCIVRAMVPTEAGNKMVDDPNFLSTLENYVRANKPEASYFVEVGGQRTMIFVMDIASSDRIPAIAEPLFHMGANVEFHPAMNMDDLRKAIQSMKK